jgi:hypothetical protein
MSASFSTIKTCYVISSKYNLGGDYSVEQTPQYYKFTLVKPVFKGWHPIGTVTYVLLSQEMGWGDWKDVTADKIVMSKEIPLFRTDPDFAKLAFAYSDDETAPLMRGYYFVQKTETYYRFSLRHPLTSEPELIVKIGKITSIPLTQKMGLDDSHNPFGDFTNVTPDKITIGED